MIKVNRKYRNVLAALLLLFAASGCAKIFTMRMPEEFSGKKLKEDPPPYQDEGKDPLDAYTDDAAKDETAK
jgi:hypothetical protein